MLKVIASNDIKISGKLEDLQVAHAFAQKHLTFWNPAYISARRTGRWISQEMRASARITGFEIFDDYISLPRGFWYRLKAHLDEQNIRYKLLNETIERPYHKKYKYAIPVDIRPYQVEAVDKAVRKSGVIQAPCGSGKTQILTEIIRRKNQWSLIIVHTEDLIVQMRERLEESFGMPIGLIRQTTEDIQPITVASVMTLKNRDLSADFLNKWGLVALDESHHMPADSFQTVIKQFPARWRYGTTATTKRADGLHGLMYAVIGYRLYDIPYSRLYDEGWLMPAQVKVIDTSFFFQMYSSKQYQKMVGTLAVDERRNSFIVDNLLKSRNHFNLVLSSRIDHLQALYDLMLQRRPELTERARMLTGRAGKDERREILRDMRLGDINYIFATQLADEGLDVPVLDRLHLVYPTRSERKIQQQVGRIQRTHPDKDDAIVYDYRDRLIGILERQFRARTTVYRATGCTVVMPKGEIAMKEFALS
jgi:superfamily II DNA or RNA helicase